MVAYNELDITFNQYTGELLIIAPVGSCIKIDKRKSDDKWITLTFHTANGTCDDSVTYTIEGSALLRIYFCNDDYTDCGDPYETEFHVKGKSNTGAIIGISLTTVVLLAALCVGIFVYVRRRNSKDTEDNVGPVYGNPKTVAFDDYMDIVTPKDKPGNGVDNEGAYAELRQTKTEYMGLVFTNRNQGMLESNDDIETTNEPLQLYAECDLKSPPASSDLVFGDTIIDGVFTKLVKARLTVSSQRALTVSVKMLKDPNGMLKNKLYFSWYYEFTFTLIFKRTILFFRHIIT
ncbi:uncharacterized protein [Ptychodera flava]|uniref:uncharacterized protein n=1 Tax=Ptychodera flava TaxID=63121 RepID=UPI003969F920